MKVGFYLDNSGFSSIDCSEIRNGNPGIGGTEYMFLLVSTMLSQRENCIDVTFFATNTFVFPTGLNVVLCNCLSDCIAKVEAEKFDYLIIKHDVDANINSHALESAMPLHTQIIVWAHVFMCFWELDYYAANANVVKIVNVGKETLDLYIDHSVYDKSTYIFNAVNTNGARKVCKNYPLDKRGNVVTYIGQLSPFKGFHLLAKAWKKILKEVPDAQLYIVGSGKLYDKNSTLGHYNIAASEYESQFMPYITDENGKILDSVHFMGVLGKEKNDILLQTKVGVPNPSGITETFCISAVEMQLMGARIATYKSPGFMDTVRNGILGTRRSQLADNIISLLRSDFTDYHEAMNYFETTFSPDIILNKWENLLSGEDEKVDLGRNIGYRFKWIKIVMRTIKKRSRFLGRKIPMVERVLLYIERKIHGPVTYLDSDTKA